MNRIAAALLIATCITSKPKDEAPCSPPLTPADAGVEQGAEYALTLVSVNSEEDVEGMYMPVKPSSEWLPPGSRLIDGGCVPGVQHARNGAVRFAADCRSLVVYCDRCDLPRPGNP